MERGGGNRNSYLLSPGRRNLERRWDRHTEGPRRRIGSYNGSGSPAGRSAGSSRTFRSAGEAPQVQSGARREFAWLDPLHPRENGPGVRHATAYETDRYAQAQAEAVGIFSTADVRDVPGGPRRLETPERVGGRHRPVGLRLSPR